MVMPMVPLVLPMVQLVKDCQFGVSPVNYSDSDSDQIGLPMVPIVPLGDPMVPLALPLVQMVLPMVPMVKP